MTNSAFPRSDHYDAYMREKKKERAQALARWCAFIAAFLTIKVFLIMSMMND